MKNTDARPQNSKSQIDVDEWIALGKELYGDNKDDWQFKCASCGNVQSATAVREKCPGVDDGHNEGWLRNYLAMNCEGRLLNNNRGCDWSLGGLFQIHKVEVIDGDRLVPIFEFADTAVPQEEQ